MDPTTVLDEPTPQHVYLIIATYPDGATETSLAQYSHTDENGRAFWISPFMTQGPSKVKIVRELALTSEDVV